ncbi:MAG: hypothetical protein FK733_06835 [Asgard group archaeon]|nr:hypothetical protein [Asgard group archaeon]
MTQEILVRYGELALKSPSVRRHMEFKLISNIQLLLEKHSIQHTSVFLKRSWGRIIIAINDKVKEQSEQILSLLMKYGIGITSFSIAIKTSSELSSIKETALKLAEEKLKPNMTFVVRARRIGKHSYTSNELERLVGEVIYETLAQKRNLSVNLTKPDYTLFIEVKDEFAYIFDTRVKGYGGLPQSTHGTIASIMRGSQEDVLAAFLLAKRGSLIEPVLFQLKNKNHDNISALNEHLHFFNKLQPKKNLTYHTVNFNILLEQIGVSNLKCSICDELCAKITNKCLKNNKRINGLSLGNNSTALVDRKIISSYQTIGIPIYYPIIAINSEEIHHPFGEGFKSSFCLASCPGYKNEKKKEIKSLSQAELDQIVTGIDYSIFSTNKT